MVIFLQPPCIAVQGGYFFMYFITSRITTNKIISNTVSVIHITPLFGVQKNRRRSVTTNIIISGMHYLSIIIAKYTKGRVAVSTVTRPYLLIKCSIWMLRFQSKSTAKVSRRLLKSADLPLRQGQSRFCLPAKAGLSLQSLTS